MTDRLRSRASAPPSFSARIGALIGARVGAHIGTLVAAGAAILPLQISAATQAPRTTSAVGHCPDGAPATIATGPYAGHALDALREPTLGRLHEAHTQSFGQAWLTRPANSGPNRAVRVRGRDGRVQEVIVLTICGSADCNVRAYEAFNPLTQDWGASIYNGGPAVELGHPVMPGAAEEVVPAALSGPIICAQDLDWGVK